MVVLGSVLASVLHLDLPANLGLKRCPDSHPRHIACIAADPENVAYRTTFHRTHDDTIKSTNDNTNGNPQTTKRSSVQFRGGGGDITGAIHQRGGGGVGEINERKLIFIHKWKTED